MASVLLTGANGVVGHLLRKRLEHAQHAVCCVSRNPDGSSANNLQWNLQQAPDDKLTDQLTAMKIDVLIHCAPIWLLPNHLDRLATLGVRRIVVFSSSSVTSKQHSKDSSEHQLVKQLSGAEKALEQFCLKQNVNLTIFRPSMIYGYARDQNISHLARLIKRYGFMLLVGQANGLRQPVHADDLVNATMEVLDNPVSFGKTYHLAGAEVITYRVMVERIFVALNKPVRIICLPLVVFRLVLKMAAIFGRFSYTPEMADRMNQNLNYDNGAAQQDFSYAPQAFLSEPKRDIV